MATIGSAMNVKTQSIEVLEATSRIELQTLLRKYLEENNATANCKISYASYEDFDSEQIVYTATIFSLKA